MALGRLHAERFEPYILGIRDDPDRDDRVAEFGAFGLAVLGLDLRSDAVGGGFEFLDPGAGEDRHALFLELLFQESRHIGILDGDKAIQHFDDGHVGAHVAVEACKFDPDRARSDNEQFLGHFGRDERVAISPDALAVGGRERQVTRARAGGDDDILGGEGFAALLAFHFQLARRGQRALAHMDGDLVLLHQEGNALA